MASSDDDVDVNPTINAIDAQGVRRLFHSHSSELAAALTQALRNGNSLDPRRRR